MQDPKDVSRPAPASAHKPPENPSIELSTAQVAQRLGVSTRQLQSLRLRGIGPQIIQSGLSVHYELKDVQDVERHEAIALIEQVLASDHPLVLLRTMVDSVNLKLSAILQNVTSMTTTRDTEQPTAGAQIDRPPTHPMRELSMTPPLCPPASCMAELKPLAHPAVPAATPASSDLSPSPALVTASAPKSGPPLEPAAATPTTAWHLLLTKPRQENVALLNLQRQGWECYLPQLRIERVRQRKAEITTEPMFPRYLFIRLDDSQQGKSWFPIRSTLGVSQLVHFGARAAKVPDALIDSLKARQQALPAQALFKPGEPVFITSGPFAGVEAIFQATDAERRVLILLEILSKPVSMQIDAGQLRRVG